MDPVSCVALATGAFKALKGAIGAGKDLQEMTGQLSTWGKAFSDFTNLEEREKNPPFWKKTCLLYTSPSPRDGLLSRMPSSA